MIKTFKTSLTAQVLTGMFLGFSLVVLVMARFGNQEIRRAVAEQYVDEAYHTARTARTYLNPDHISDYVSPDGGAHRSECRYIQKEWQRLADRDSQEVLMIYLIQTEGQDHSHIRYGLAAVHPSLFEEYPGFKLHPPGVTARSGEAQQKAYARIYQGAKRAVVLQPWQWKEDHLTVIIPVKTKEGEVVGVLGVQRKMENLRAASNSHVRKVLFAAVALLAIILPMRAWGLRRWILKPIKTITAETLRFAKEDTMPSVPLGATVRMSNEIGQLARSIDDMEAENVEYVSNLLRVTAEKEQIKAELNVARDIQMSMLPIDFSLRPEIGLYAVMDAAKEVGGDFYDFYPIDGERVAVTIADVSGKGVPAALFMVVAKTVLKNFISSAPDEPGALAGAVGHANRQLCQNNDSMMFVTVFTGILNTRTGAFTYVNAGHNPPLRSISGRFEFLPLARNGFLGISESIQFQEDTLTLSHGDGLFLYTDGLTEAEDDGKNLFGNQRLLDALNNHEGAGGERGLLEHVKVKVNDFVKSAPQSDDLTMLYVRCTGAVDGHSGRFER